MRIAYLVAAYRNPILVARQIATLSSRGAHFFIHIDQKSEIGAFSAIAGDNITYVDKRFTIYWAEFGLIEAIFELLSAALNASLAFDYLVLLGGSEYPLRDAAYIEAFMERHAGTEFINMVRMPSPDAGKPLSHLNTYRVPSSLPVRRFLVRLMSRAGLVRRDYKKHLSNLVPYGGDTWWALTRDACKYIAEFAQLNSKIIKFFENVASPEEVLFQTILGNSKFKGRIRRNLMYDDWSAGGYHPELIDEQHVARFASVDGVKVDDVFGPGEVLFARKFSDANLDLVDRVDAMITRKEQSSVAPAN